MTKHHLTVRKIVDSASPVEGQYEVRCDLRPVGRIGLVTDTSAQWEWAIHVSGFLVPPWGSGQASSFEGAKAAFLEAWVGFYGMLGPSLFQYWQQHEVPYEQKETHVPLSSPREHDDLVNELFRAHDEAAAPETQVQGETAMDGQPKSIPQSQDLPGAGVDRDAWLVEEDKLAHIRHLIGE